MTATFRFAFGVPPPFRLTHPRSPKDECARRLRPARNRGRASSWRVKRTPGSSSNRLARATVAPRGPSLAAGGVGEAAKHDRGTLGDVLPRGLAPPALCTLACPAIEAPSPRGADRASRWNSAAAPAVASLSFTQSGPPRRDNKQACRPLGARPCVPPLGMHRCQSCLPPRRRAP